MHNPNHLKDWRSGEYLSDPSCQVCVKQEELKTMSNSGVGSSVNHPLPDYCFRNLEPEEVAEFQEWARKKWKDGTLDRTKLGLYHPTVRAEVKRLDDEKFNVFLEEGKE